MMTDHRAPVSADDHDQAREPSLIENAVFGIYQVSADGQFLSVNPALVQMLGYTSKTELFAVPMPTLYQNPAIREQLVREWSQSPRMHTAEVEWHRKDGTPILVRLSGRRVVMHDQSGFEVIAEDITDRRSLEARLQQAERMEAIGLLAGGIAHDFNNIVTALLGYTEMILQQIDEDKPIWPDLQQIREAANRAAALTQQLLAFSRRQVLRIEPVNLNEVVEGIEPLLRQVLSERVDIQHRLSPDPRRCPSAGAGPPESRSQRA